MIRPSEVDTSRPFMGSVFENYERETIAYNIVLLSQAVAYANDDDRWPAFTAEDYDTFRQATSTEPVTSKERAVIAGLAREGYLSQGKDGIFTVSNRFLGIVCQFATPESAAQVIAQ